MVSVHRVLVLNNYRVKQIHYWLKFALIIKKKDVLQ